MNLTVNVLSTKFVLLFLLRLTVNFATGS